MVKVLDRLAAWPLALVGALLAAGGLLAFVHVTLIGLAGAEWPQWTARLTVMWYWVLIPLGVLALWARRRAEQGRTGRVAAVLMALGIAGYLVVTAATVVWGGILGRGDLPTWFMALEALNLVMIVGIVVGCVAMLRDRAVPKLWPALLLAAVLVNVVWAPGLTICLLALGAVLAMDSARVRRAA